jgi:hypothetical protein
MMRATALPSSARVGNRARTCFEEIADLQGRPDDQRDGGPPAGPAADGDGGDDAGLEVPRDSVGTFSRPRRRRALDGEFPPRGGHEVPAGPLSVAGHPGAQVGGDAVRIPGDNITRHEILSPSLMKKTSTTSNKSA